MKSINFGASLQKKEYVRIARWFSITSAMISALIICILCVHCYYVIKTQSLKKKYMILHKRVAPQLLAYKQIQDTQKKIDDLQRQSALLKAQQDADPYQIITEIEKIPLHTVHHYNLDSKKEIVQVACPQASTQALIDTVTHCSPKKKISLIALEHQDQNRQLLTLQLEPTL